jgi:ATP-dependent DNA ligase
MLKAFDFCIPTRGTKVPSSPDWLDEIKYDGYRLRVKRNGGRVRLITRNGRDWTNRYPWIVEAALLGLTGGLASGRSALYTTFRHVCDLVAIR